MRVDGVRVKAPQGAGLPGAQQAARRRHHAQATPRAGRRSWTSCPRWPGCSRWAGSTSPPRACILLTNDGAFAERVSHPRYEVPRVYHAKVHRRARRAGARAAAARACRVDGDLMAVDRVRVIEADNNAWVEVTLHEGKQHEVKRLLEAVGPPGLEAAPRGVRAGDDARASSPGSSARSRPRRSTGCCRARAAAPGRTRAPRRRRPRPRPRRSAPRGAPAPRGASDARRAAALARGARSRGAEAPLGREARRARAAKRRPRARAEASPRRARAGPRGGRR